MQKELVLKNPLLKLSFEFAILILEYCDALDQLHKYAISKQLIRSGTSIGANALEAQNAESKADFIHKIKLQQRKQTKRSTGSAYANLHLVILVSEY
ncbi:MAG: four helix bundle protein [Ferruginibacter sp.]|nr:four helix bundle protein [Ferruginibacter sp.]